MLKCNSGWLLAQRSAFHLLFLSVMLISGCDARRTVDVKYVFPKDYQGLAVIALNRKDGIPVKSTRDLFELRFPRSGILKIQDEGPFAHPFREIAKFTDGRKIQMDGIDLQVPGAVSLKWLGHRHDDTIWLFIGTELERKRALAAGELQLGEYRYPGN